MEMKKEVRLAELRTRDDLDMVVEGRAVVSDTPTVMYESDGVKYYEVIDRQALDGCDMKDVAFKYNHSQSVMVMARTRNRTLELVPDNHGLLIRATLANTTAGRDLYELIRRKDVDKMSFAFTVDKESYDRDTRTRTILRFKKIWDVSAVDTPAYPDTSITARDYFELEREREKKALDRALLRERLKLMTY